MCKKREREREMIICFILFCRLVTHARRMKPDAWKRKRTAEYHKLTAAAAGKNAPPAAAAAAAAATAMEHDAGKGRGRGQGRGRGRGRRGRGATDDNGTSSVVLLLLSRQPHAFSLRHKTRQTRAFSVGASESGEEIYELEQSEKEWPMKF